MFRLTVDPGVALDKEKGRSIGTTTVSFISQQPPVPPGWNTVSGQLRNARPPADAQGHIWFVVAFISAGFSIRILG
ncbi:hypothetical protein GJ744_000891 [Endocarpon pusillum]|uniref:Uncharacterized protein n=1 Tax=Endocarpon pusillum TaxID=364733 RepID=A0A8H7AX02_9EURO|nr:hypothetical protein GJ744_000891 [Endocarpon pusillum]